MTRSQRGALLTPPDLDIEVGHDLELDAQIEQRAAQRIEDMRIIRYTREGDLHDATRGCDTAQFARALQHPFFDGASKRALNFLRVHHGSSYLLSQGQRIKP